jgi:hypothetical protein
MKPDVIAWQWRDVAFHGTTRNDKVKNAPFADKSIRG